MPLVMQPLTRRQSLIKHWLRTRLFVAMKDAKMKEGVPACRERFYLGRLARATIRATE